MSPDVKIDILEKKPARLWPVGDCQKVIKEDQARCSDKDKVFVMSSDARCACLRHEDFPKISDDSNSCQKPKLCEEGLEWATLSIEGKIVGCGCFDQVPYKRTPVLGFNNLYSEKKYHMPKATVL